MRAEIGIRGDLELQIGKNEEGEMAVTKVSAVLEQKDVDKVGGLVNEIKSALTVYSLAKKTGADTGGLDAIIDDIGKRFSRKMSADSKAKPKA
jgi:hypothetical protein